MYSINDLPDGVIFPLDLHNHTSCSDGANTAAELIRNALENGVRTIGITDHFETSYTNLNRHNLNSYIEDIRRAAADVSGINVKVGVEVCAQSCVEREIQCFDVFKPLDYVLFEHLDFSDRMELHTFARWVNNFPCKKGLAHTNLFQLFRLYGMEDTLHVLQDCHLFWELNTSYPYFEWTKKNFNKPVIQDVFARISEHGISVSCGSDTHSFYHYEEKLKKLMWANNVVLKRV